MRCASPSFAFSLMMMGHDDDDDDNNNNNNNGSAFAFLQSHVSFTLLTMYIVYGYFVTIHDFFFIYTYYIIDVFSYRHSSQLEPFQGYKRYGV